jgi:nitrite reductase (NADH) small subunit
MQTVITETLVGSLSQIPVGEGRNFEIGDTLVAVFHTRSGAVYATQALCPHRQGPLADGLLGGSTLMCPFHSWKFNLPNGDAVLGECGITVYPTRTTETGDIFVTIAPCNE